MARPGARPKPTEAHQRDGTRRRGQGQVETPNLVAGRDRPERPPGLDKDARKVWDVVVDDLMEGNVIDKADWSVIEVFAVEVARLRQARRIIQSEGLITEGQKGSPVIHPARQIEQQAGKNVSSLADSLGLGPSGRARLGIAKRGAAGQGAGRSHNQDAQSRGVPDSPRARRAAMRSVQGGAG